MDALQSMTKDVKMFCQKYTKAINIAKVKHFHIQMIEDTQYIVFDNIVCTKSPFYS